MRPPCGWSATTCRSAAGWSIRRAGRSPGATVRLCQVGTVKDRSRPRRDARLGRAGQRPDLAWYGDYHGDLAGRAEHLDDRRRRPVRGQGGVGRDRIAWLRSAARCWRRARSTRWPGRPRTQPKPRPQPTTPEPGHDVLRQPQPAARLCRRDLRAHRRPDQADRRRRPIEGDGPARCEGSRSSARRGRPGRRSWPGPTRRAASGSSACPRASSIRLTANDGYGAIDPFLGARITVTDTEGLKPIETTIELPRGVVITGRLIDPATGRPVRAGQISYVKLPTNPNARGYITRPRTSPTDPTLPPDRPARRGDALRPGPRQGPPLPHAPA